MCFQLVRRMISHPGCLCEDIFRKIKMKVKVKKTGLRSNYPDQFPTEKILINIYKISELDE